jgi:glycosyltransferase 2 family protein
MPPAPEFRTAEIQNPLPGMKLGVTVATVTGLALLIALLVYNDAAAVFATVGQVGWGLAGVVLVRAAILVLAGFGWERLVAPFVSVAPHVYLRLRWIRESIDVLLPVLQVGGDLMGGRLLTFWGVSGGRAGASILVDLVLQLGTQFLFTLAAFSVFALTQTDMAIVRLVAGGLVMSALTLAGFYVFQRSGLIRLTEGLPLYAVKRWPSLSFGGVRALHECVQSSYRDVRALSVSFVLHLLAWFLGVLEIWITLTCIGLQPGWGECLVVESLGQAVRSADFAIPGVMGVQEGGFLVIGGLYGIRPEVSLALSLVKRVPDIVLGIPGLLAWLHLETNRAKRARALPQID